MSMFTAFCNAWTALFAQHHVSDEEAAHGWGRFPERLTDGRGGHTHLNHL